MKHLFARELWYMSVLGIVALTETGAALVFGLSSVNAHYYDAGLVRLALAISTLFLLIATGCFALEWMLLKKRKLTLMAASKMPGLVFGVGLIPALIMIRMWIALV